MLCCFLHASSERIMTYNLLNFLGNDDRESDFINIIDLAEPDILVAQEVVGQTGFSRFKSDVLDVVEPGAWSGASFTNQSAQQDIALYYKHEAFTFVSTSVVYTAQSGGTRDVIEWEMFHISSGVQFKIYGVHLKATQSSSEERLAETTVLRNHLNNHPPNSHFIVAGDFNIYSNNPSSEPAFEMLTGSSDDNDGQLFDPINRIGHWHNNSGFADVHTQSPRTTQFGGGANGGMDDRFDWLFVSQSLLDESSDFQYVEDTYLALGNDGNHFNDAITDGNNSSVNNTIANALHDASDHLPVYMDVWFDDLTFSDVGIMISEIMVNPSSVSDSYGEWFEIVNTTNDVVDISGWSIVDTGDDQHIISSDESPLAVNPGEYFILSKNGNPNSNGGINSDYVYNNFSLSNSEDEVILLDEAGAIVDEVHYNSQWPFSSGVAMEIHDLTVENNLIDNWYASTLNYGSGQFGSPGIAYNGTLNINSGSHILNRFSVISIYPNPFNNFVTINIDIDQENHIVLEVFDILGQKIATLNNGLLHLGFNQFTWDATGHPTGIYFFKFTSGPRYTVRKAAFLK